MTNFNEEELLQKYREGKCSEEELRWIEAWYGDWNMNSRAVLSESDLNTAEQLMRANVMQRTGVGTVRLWPRVAGIAAVLTAMLFGIWFFSAPRHPDAGQDPANAQYANTIAPGKNTATLTLSNGKTINLSDAKTGVVFGNGKLAYNDGSAVDEVSGRRHPGEGRDLNAVDNLTITTPRGGTYQITLPDGTKVWLNAASSLTYTAPSKVSAGVRKVVLSGEAYFEVFRNKKQPFVVNSKKMELTVLGTHFNVSAYNDEVATKTTLLEGSVEVTALTKHPEPRSATRNTQRLSPNQQSVITDNNQLVVKATDAHEAIAWKEGLFRFENENIKSAMRKLERWYNVRVSYEQGVENSRIGGIISRYENVAEVLHMINATKTVICKLEGREIMVMPYKN